MKRRHQRERAQPRVVDLVSDPLDFKCCLLASFGQTTRSIAANTGLSEGQVTYRLGKAKEVVDRHGFRNGTSGVIVRLLKSNADWAEAPLRRELRKIGA